MISEAARPNSLPLAAWLSKDRLVAVVAFLFWAAAFDLAFTQWPLYSENQHTKFLHGLAWAGYGELSGDWLANTIDPLPAFSGLVFLVQRFLHPFAFYAIHLLLVGVYLYSVQGIADRLFGVNRTWAGRLLFPALIIALHSSLLPPFSTPVLGVSLGWLLQAGVANQYLLNPALQPSTFGVLLALSIYLYLVDRPIWAAAAAAVAAVFHSTYLPAAALLTIVYMAAAWRQGRDIRRPLLIGGAALLIVLPVLAYNLLALGPTSAGLWAQAQEIIVHFRIPHHSLPEVWVDRTVWAKLALVAAALALAVRSRLFPVLLTLTLAAVGLTLVQMRWPNDTLAFVAPWRLSALLVPLATSVILGAAVAWLTAPRRIGAGIAGKIVAVASILLLAAAAGYGVEAMRDSFAARTADDRAPMHRFVRENVQPGDVYLVPTSMGDFRLETGAPVLVTFKSHPYKDVEVIEWRRRVDAANSFYAAPACERLPALAAEFGLTHAVLEGEGRLDGCPAAEQLYDDGWRRVVRIQR